MLGGGGPVHAEVDESIVKGRQVALDREWRFQLAVDRAPIIVGGGPLAQRRPIQVVHLARGRDAGRRLEVIGGRVVRHEEPSLAQCCEKRRVVVAEVVRQDAARSVLLGDHPVDVRPLGGIARDAAGQGTCRWGDRHQPEVHEEGADDEQIEHDQQPCRDVENHDHPMSDPRQAPHHRRGGDGQQDPGAHQHPVPEEHGADPVPGHPVGVEEGDQDRADQRSPGPVAGQRPKDAVGDRGNTERHGQRNEDLHQIHCFVDVLGIQEDHRIGGRQERVDRHRKGAAKPPGNVHGRADDGTIASRLSGAAAATADVLWLASGGSGLDAERRMSDAAGQMCDPTPWTTW